MSQPTLEFCGRYTCGVCYDCLCYNIGHMEAREVRQEGQIKSIECEKKVLQMEVESLRILCLKLDERITEKYYEFLKSEEYPAAHFLEEVMSKISKWKDEVVIEDLAK